MGAGRTSWLRGACAAALALPALACGSSPAPPVAAPAQVELDIFSGRPNPTWTLSDADDADLRARLAALPSASAATLHSDLGYRGLIVRLADPAGPQVVRIQRGHVQADGAEPPAEGNRADSGRSLERWLLGTGRSGLEPGLYDIALQDKGPPLSAG